MLELPVERLHSPQALPASWWFLRARDGARDGSSCSCSWRDVLSLRCSSWTYFTSIVVGVPCAAPPPSRSAPQPLQRPRFLHPYVRALLRLEHYYQTDCRRPSARMSALWESVQRSVCSCGLSGHSSGYASRMATCAWRRAAPRQLRGSPTHVTCMHRRTCEGELSRKMSDVSVPRCDAIGAARLGRIPGPRCGRMSKFECHELTVVVISRALTHKTLGCGGAALWGRGRDRPFRHSYTIVDTPCRF